MPRYLLSALVRPLARLARPVRRRLQQEHTLPRGRRRQRHFARVLVRVVVASLFVYLGYQFFYGQSGWLAKRAVSERVERLQAEVEQLRGERDRLQQRIDLLGDWAVDPDLLDEEALRALGFGGKGDILILVPEEVLVPEDGVAPRGAQTGEGQQEQGARP